MRAYSVGGGNHLGKRRFSFQFGSRRQTFPCRSSEVCHSQSMTRDCCAHDHHHLSTHTSSRRFKPDACHLREFCKEHGAGPKPGSWPRRCGGSNRGSIVAPERTKCTSYRGKFQTGGGKELTRQETEAWHRAGETTVHDRPRPIHLVVAREPIQQRKVDQIHNASEAGAIRDTRPPTLWRSWWNR
jgi:hypothetical protein